MNYKINDEQNDLLVRILRDIHTNWGDLELGDYGHTNVPGVVKAHMFGAVGYDSGVRENTKQLFMALGFTEDDYKVLRSLARKGGPIMSLSYDDFCFHMDIDLSVWKNVVFPQYVNVEKIANKCTLPIRDRQQDEQKAINRIVHKKDDFFGEWYEFRVGYKTIRTRDFDDMIPHVVDSLADFNYERQCLK